MKAQDHCCVMDVGKFPVTGVMIPLEAYCRSLGNYYKRTGSSSGLLRPQPVLGEVSAGSF